MYWRWRKFVEDRAIDMTGETSTEEFDRTGFVSAMLVKLNFTADVALIDAAKDRIIEWIPNISVIANNDITIKSASARAFCGLNFFNRGREVYEQRKVWNDAENYVEIPILFGRHLRDLEYGLDLSKWDKVEVNITNEDSATGDFFDIGKYSIDLLQVFDKEPAWKGYIRTKQTKKWTPADVDDEYTERLPTKHKIRLLMLEVVPKPQARTIDFVAEATTLLKELEYTYKEGALIRYKGTSERLMKDNAADFGLAQVGGAILGQNADLIDSGLMRVVEQIAQYGEAVANPDTAAVGQTGLDATRTKQKLMITQGATVADRRHLWRAKGMGYLDCLIFKHDLAGWDYILDPIVYKPMKLWLKAGSKEGEIRINVEEEILYT